jgi:hypothetical protein
LLPFIALGWTQRRRSERTLIASLGVFAGITYFIWLVGAATSWFLVQLRLLLPIFPAVALIAALATSDLEPAVRRTSLLRIVRAAVLVVGVIALLRAVVVVIEDRPLVVAFGVESEDDYLAQGLGLHHTAMKQITELPQTARVLTLWEPRAFYCGQRCLPDSMINLWWHDRQVYRDPGRIADHWRSQGITHVLIFESGKDFLVNEEPHEPLTDADIDALNSLRQSEMIELWSGYGAYTLYELRNGDTP